MMLVKGHHVSVTQDGQRPAVQLALELGRRRSRRARPKTWAQALIPPNVFPLDLTSLIVKGGSSCLWQSYCEGSLWTVPDERWELS